MKTIKLSALTEEPLLEIISLDEKGIAHYPWLDVPDIIISPDEQVSVGRLKARLLIGETTDIRQKIYILTIHQDQPFLKQL